MQQILAFKTYYSKNLTGTMDEPIEILRNGVKIKVLVYSKLYVTSSGKRAKRKIKLKIFVFETRLLNYFMKKSATLNSEFFL